MITTEVGKIIKILSEHEGMQELQVEVNRSQEKAYHYTDWLPVRLKPGDWVRLNTTAVRLKLGTGGYHFVIGVEKAALPQIEMSEKLEGSFDDAGHMMKLRYTPLQRSVLAVEEESSRFHSIFKEKHRLDGAPVLIGELHSMLPIVACWLHDLQITLQPQRPVKLNYIMTDGGALPLQMSRHVRNLKQLGWLSTTITYGHAYGGEIEAMNKFTAMLASRWVAKGDISLATMGPGIAGTGTLLGHTGMEITELIHAVYAMGGRPIVIPRISFCDARDRHYGLSHHTKATLGKMALCSAILPLPDLPQQDQKQHLKAQLQAWNIEQQHEIHWIGNITSDRVRQALSDYPEVIKTMDRTFDEDEAFFMGVCAATQFAWEVAQRIIQSEQSDS